MQRDFHYGVYIGRFQPIHIGHEHIIREALERVDTLIMVVGSAFQARTPINPFTFEERAQMIRAIFSHECSTGRLIILPMRDLEDDDDWVTAVKITVDLAILNHGNNNGPHLHGTRDFKTALAGFGKDASSFYLKMFPDWGSIQIDTQHGTINASDIRDDYIHRLPRLPRDAVHTKTLAFLRDWSLTEPFRRLVNERIALEKGRAQYGSGPFMCADALVEWRGKILLVTRGGDVGYGLMAMPGGFVNHDEKTFAACLRELNEETTLDGADWERYLQSTTLAENPKRSLRGRVFSMVYHFIIPDDVELKTPVGSDDAKHAAWYDLANLHSDQFFDDHYNIIRGFI